MSAKKIALVTGTSSGFGLYTSIELAKKHYFVIATMRDLHKQNQLVAVAEENKVRDQIEILELDVTNKQQIPKVVNDIYERFGRLDVLVNNAGISFGGYVEETSVEDWELMMNTNFLGVVLLTTAVLPLMREQRNGKIINISSVSGSVGFPGYGAYSASKFALEGFSESLRLEMLPYGVEVILIEPGAYQTAIWDKSIDYIEYRKKENSPYQKPFSAILAFSKNITKKATDPQQLAKKIANIVESNRTKFRYPLGKGALVAIWGKALLPWKWFERIILQQLKK
ncbi:SDR family oxidoreductase [Bacillus niameyensis]|uniref:SDR family oxidoreductase n=1 Tax=Bacillus niameyensis TaxID=1522308 RepID=UPI000782480F|nr:SDR family oxidoreductase [Bacillus niameyensis]